MCILFFLPGNDLPSTGWLHVLHLDKAVHFGLFFVLVILFSIPVFRSAISKTRKLQLLIGFAIVAVLWGIAVEFIQEKYINGRSFDLWDWFWDSLGIFAGVYFMERIKTAFPE